MFDYVKIIGILGGFQKDIYEFPGVKLVTKGLRKLVDRVERIDCEKKWIVTELRDSLALYMKE